MEVGGGDQVKNGFLPLPDKLGLTSSVNVREATAPDVFERLQRMMGWKLGCWGGKMQISALSPVLKPRLT